MSCNWTRRGFLAASAGTVMAASHMTRTASAADDDAKGFLLGIQSYSLREFPVEEALRYTHELGLGSIEFFGQHLSLTSTPDEIEKMKKRLAELDIQLLGHGVNGFTKDHEANRKIFKFARLAGIRNLSADPTEDSFDSLDKLVDEYEIRIAIHNHGPGARYDKIADVLKAIEGHDKRIGACADLGHYIRSGEDPVRAIQLFEGRLYGVHLKDFAEPKADAKGVILGKGQLDVVGTFRALSKVEFPADGSLSIEYEENAKDPIDDIRQCVEIARDAAKSALA